MKKRPVIIFISLFLGMYLFPYIPLELFNINYYNFSSNMKNIYNFICDICYMLIIFIIYHKDLTDNFKNLIKNFNKIMYKSFNYYLIGLFFMFISNVIIGHIFIEANTNNENMVRNMITMYPVYMFFSVSIYAPFVEEIIFRKSIKEMFIDSKITKYAYIIISGFIFAFMHIYGDTSSSLDYLYIVSYMAVGVSFAYAYYESNNIFTTILLHSLHNTTALILFLWLGV